MFSNSDILSQRIHNQLITPHESRTTPELAGYMGAMQAQDYPMSKWALGLRMEASEREVEDVINRGEIIRTHVLRPTWHLVAARDLRWLLDLTAGRLLAGVAGRHKELELDEKLLNQCLRILENAFDSPDSDGRDGDDDGRRSDGRHFLERETLVKALNRHGIRTNDNRASHILFHAELSGLLCSGENRGNKQTYALLRDRVPESPAIGRPEAIAQLACRYFTSHGPATLRDFSWWSGLTLREARQGIESLGTRDFKRADVNAVEYWYPVATSSASPDRAVFLPAFDEFIISYADKTPLGLDENTRKVFAINGLFRPVILIGPEIAGIWKRTIRKNTVKIETDYFRPLSRPEKEKVETAANGYARFVEAAMQLSHSRF